MNDNTKHLIDAVAIVATAGTVLSVIPAIAGIFSIVWTGMRIVEMLTGKTINEILTRKKKDAA
jgi:hypothetical protein